MARMTGGQAVVKALQANGTTAIFGIPGMHNLPIYDALYHKGPALRHILARHEGGAGLMANGYARAVRVPPGHSRVEMVYAPSSIRIGSVCSFLMFALLAGRFALVRRQRS